MKKIRPRVFLGGTCGKSTWREELIPLLTKVDYFNPAVDDWTPACQEIEIHERNTCDFVLYVISPEMEGVYSIAEVVDDSNKRPKKTVFCVIPKSKNKEFSKAQLKSLKAVSDMVSKNKGKVCLNLKEVATYLNNQSLVESYKTRNL